MTSTQSKSPGATAFGLREPSSDETSRVSHLFRGVLLPAQARVVVALKSRPIERFIGAVAWWAEGNIARFRLAYLPGLSAEIRSELVTALLKCMEERVPSANMETLHYGELLTDDHELCQLLRENGFERWRSERHFEVPVQESHARTMRMYEKYRTEIPARWRTEPIRNHPPELILSLIQDYRLMTPAELRNYWRPDSAQGFDLDFSAILFAETQPIGALLTRRVQDSLYIDVRVVHLKNKWLRALGNICLLQHMAERREANCPIHWLRFRAGEVEHRETASVAFRMGGRELPPRHLFQKMLSRAV